MRTRNSPGTPKREHAGQQARTDAVRVRPRVHPTGPSRARTYGGQGRPRRPPPATYAQVRSHIGGSEQAVCKTVGLAYVGSNPTPATTCGNSLWPASMRSGVDLVRVRWRTAETGALRLLVVEWWLSATPLRQL